MRRFDADEDRPDAARPTTHRHCDERHPATTDPLTPMTVLGLQRRAGNTAVCSMVGRQPDESVMLQRAPFTAVPPAAPQTAATGTDELQLRIDEAKKTIATAGWFGKAVAELYGTRPRPLDELVTAVLTGHLRLPELATPGTAIDAKVKPAADRLRGAVSAGVTNGLNTTMTAIGAALPGRAAELEPFVTARQQNSLWTFDDLVTEVWDHWLGCTPFAEVVKVAGSARETRKALEKIVALAVRAYATSHFTGAALAALSGPPRAATKAWLEPRTTWVTAPADLDTLTDHVLTTTRVTFRDHSDPAWTDMRARITDFVVAAETDIIKAEIDKNWTGATTEEVWSRARGMYVGTIEKPVWKFYRDDIVGFTLFGHGVGKASGVHQNVAPELARVEASAKRLAGTAWSTTKLPAGYGFRFQPQDGKFDQNAHVSLHATGRAIDFDPVHNPFTSGSAKRLAGLLGGVDFDAPGGMPGFGELARLGADIAARHARKAALEAQLKGQLSDEERGAAEQQLKDVTAEIDALPDRADVQSIRDRAGQAHDDLVKAQTEFLTVWQELTGGSGQAADIDPKQVIARLAPLRIKAGAELAPIDTRIRELTEQIDALKKESGELKAKGKAADPVTVADVKARLTKAQGDLDPLRADKKRLDEQIKRLTELEKRFDPKGDGRGLLRELEKTVVAGGGFTNMPKWMVQAFAENGFTWGGGWHDPEDAMHYSSMTPVPGVAQPGMG
ncbi:hypothetical protein GCM10027290_61260 [Micromonospora sonneratiae]|uniref:M15 family metallopeptidase n=1 Tax=Micromonospora sonneratiae TaxID=1184706 RepID=A0ABW3YKL7_9ACTN